VPRCATMRDAQRNRHRRHGVRQGTARKLAAARGSPQKHVWPARIVLLTDARLGTVGIMAATGKSKTCVWRWQERFMADGVEGLRRDKTRPPGTPPLETTLVDRVVKLTLEPPDHEATHWTVGQWPKRSALQLPRW
jgi:hypothetical protein